MKVFRFALFLSFATFVLLCVGGLVNPTGSSLACPDWPTCYGSFFPEMKNGVQFEHTHRVVAATVGVMTFVLAFLVNRNRKYSSAIRRLSIIAALLVILQGVLGGITVIFKLPLFVSTGHLALSMFFFSLTIYMSFRLWYERDAGTGVTDSKLQPALPRVWQLYAAVGVYLQIVLGAFVRHTHSGRSCGVDIPLCNGEAWPDVWPQRLHMIHRMFAIVVFFMVVISALSGMRAARQNGRLMVYRAARFAPTVVTLQILLGVVTVTSFVGLVQVTAHLAIGSLLLATMWVIYFGLGPRKIVQRMEAKASDAATVHGIEATQI